MSTRVRERFFRNTLLPESTSDTHGNLLSLKSFVTFVSFVVRNPGLGLASKLISPRALRRIFLRLSAFRAATSATFEICNRFNDFLIGDLFQ